MFVYVYILFPHRACASRALKIRGYYPMQSHSGHPTRGCIPFTTACQVTPAILHEGATTSQPRVKSLRSSHTGVYPLPPEQGHLFEHLSAHPRRSGHHVPSKLTGVHLTPSRSTTCVPAYQLSHPACQLVKSGSIRTRQQEGSRTSPTFRRGQRRLSVTPRAWGNTETPLIVLRGKELGM